MGSWFVSIGCNSPIFFLSDLQQVTTKKENYFTFYLLCIVKPPIFVTSNLTIRI